MTDALHRADERLAAQGCLDAAGRALLARVRDGSLSLARVRVAACLGEPVACAGLGLHAPPLAPSDELLVATPLALALADCGVHDCARVLLTALLALRPADATDEARALVRAFEVWVHAFGPSDDVRSALREWQRTSREHGTRFGQALESTGDLVRWSVAPPDDGPTIHVAEVDPAGQRVTTDHRGTPRFEAGHAARDALCGLLAGGRVLVVPSLLPWLLEPGGLSGG